MAGVVGVDYRPLTLRQLYLRYREVLFHQYQQTLFLQAAVLQSGGADPKLIRELRNPYAWG